MTLRVSSPRRGFGLIEMFIAIVIIGVVGYTLIVSVPSLIKPAKEMALDSKVQLLNRTAVQFVASGGRFSNTASAEANLLLLQTPVDAATKRAGLGQYNAVPHTWRLRTISDGEEGERMVMNFDSQQNRPVWRLAYSGPGFAIDEDASLSVPAEANWGQRVAEAGQTQARTSNWVWEFDDTRNTAPHPGGGGVTPPPGGGYVTEPSVGTSLWIDGSFQIKTPGTYFWTGNSTQSGTLMINVDGAARNAASATQLQSTSRTFAPGDVASFSVTFERAEGGSLTRLVEVSIPRVPTLEIQGPDQVTSLDPSTWTAVADVDSTPIQIKVESFGTKKAENVKTIASDPIVFPPGTQRTVIITASAMNGSGLSRATKQVQVNVLPLPDGVWELPPTITAGMIDARGRYSFTFRSTAGGPSQIEATGLPMGAPMYSGNVGVEPTTVTRTESPATEVPIELDFSQLTSQVRYNGVLRLTARVTNASGTKDIVRDVPFDITRSEALFSWTLTVTSQETATESIESYVLNIEKDGSLWHVENGAGQQRAFTFSKFLPVGKYEIFGAVNSNNTRTHSPTRLSLKVTP